MTPRSLVFVGLLLGCAQGGASSGGGGDASLGGAGGSVANGGSGGELVCTTGDKCDNACVDLDSDPANCGACGRTCVVANAQASCGSGECAIDACGSGFADCDGDVNNGCELAVDCNAGSACATSCNTTGAVNCTDPCAPTCDLPAEACNLADDDCDTVCDNGPVAGCRVGVHRAVSSVHFYGTSQAQAEGLGHTIENLNYFHLYATAVGGLQPFFRCPVGGATFLTTATDCEIGAAPQETIGFISATPDVCGAVPLYRTYSSAANDHFYTLSATERDNAVANLGYISEGIAGYVWTAP